MGVVALAVFYVRLLLRSCFYSKSTLSSYSRLQVYLAKNIVKTFETEERNVIQN